MESAREKYETSKIDKQLYPIGRVKIYLIFAVLNFFAAIPRYFLKPEMGIIFHGSLFLASVTWAIITWEYILLIGGLLERRLPASSNFILRIAIQTFLTYPVVTLLGDGMFSSASYIFDIPLNPSLVTIGYLLYFLMTLVLNLVYFGVKYFYSWKRDLIHLGGVQREQAIIKYDSLRNQLNPHFLFNALTSLNSLIFENQELASEFLQQLSKVYRYVLQNKDKETVPLITELNFIAHYISLLKIRFANSINFNIDLSEDAKEKKIVPVTLQILIENAVKHNIVSIASPLVISITANATHLIIENNINKKAQVETSNNQGLANLKGFYHYLSDVPIETAETQSFFTVKIPLIE